MIIKNCGTCKKPVKVYPSELQREHFCSKKCAGIAHSKRMKGRKSSLKGIKTGRIPKMAYVKNDPRIVGENNPRWAGDDAGYMGKHHWIKKVLGKANKCEFCHTKETYQYEWANKSGEYKKEISDWMQLCTKCHRKYDRNIEKMHETKERLYGNKYKNQYSKVSVL
jgi:hypothetical protein